MRAGARLGVILHRERRERLVPHALDRVVVEVYVRDFEAVRNRLWQDGEIVVLARDLHVACRKILNRMVATVVAKFQPPRLRAAGKREQLMPQTNSHYWDVSWSFELELESGIFIFLSPTRTFHSNFRQSCRNRL